MAGLLLFPVAEQMLNDMGSPRVRSTHCVLGADHGSVYVALPTPDGKWVWTTFDLSLFLTAADVFITTHGDPRCRTTRKTDSRKEG